MSMPSLVLGLICLVGGLVGGIVVGAAVIAGDDDSSTTSPAASNDATNTVTDSPTPDPSPLPTETAGWDPCATAGLCDFIERLDQRLAAGNLDGVMEMIEFIPMQCGTPEVELFEGIFPVECRDWPFSEAVPTAGYSERDSSGYPVSRWALRKNLEEFLDGSESDCLGDTEDIERRVTLVVAPPDPTLYWNGQIALLIGPPLDCFPTFELDSGRRLAFNLRSNASGEWQIESIVEVAFNDCEDAFYRYVGEIRYYPLGDGRPIIQGSPVCPENS